MEHQLEKCPRKTDTLHRKKEEELSDDKEERAKFAHELEKAQVERNYLQYKLEMYQKKIDALHQEKEKEMLDHEMEKLQLHQMLANQIERTETIMQIYSYIHGDLSSLWTDVITPPM